MSDMLLSGQRLAAGQSLKPLNGKGILSFQEDGNLVLYSLPDRKDLWSSGTAGKRGTYLVMQADGNLAIYPLATPGQSPVWSSGTHGHSGAVARMQNDGNFVIYMDTQFAQKESGGALWSSDTDGWSHTGPKGGGGFDLGIHVDLGHVFSDVTHAVSAVTHINVSPPNFKWLENAVNAAGREIGTVANAITTEAGKIGDEIKKVPIAGPLFVSTIDLMASPLAVGLDIAQGKDIAQSLITHIQADIKDVKEVAPYAQMVISFIPGIGPVVSGAIGMGIALAEGQPIDAILIAGVKGAIPGGPIAAAAFSAAVGAVQAIASNEPLAEGIMRTALDALPLPDGAAGDACRTAIKSAIKLTGAVAGGQRVDTALLNAASQNLESLKDIPGISPTMAASLKISCGAGLAVATGAVAQAQVRKSSTAPTALDKLQAEGHAIAAKDPVILAAEKPFPKGIRGFEIGIGLMQYQIGIASFTAIRSGLGGDDQKAFDTATSLHIGRVVAPPAPSLSVEARAARNITFGIQGANKEPAALLSTAMLAVPGMKAGVEIANSELPSAHPAAWATGMGLLVMAVAACTGVGVLTTYALGAVTAGAVLIWKRE